MIKRIKRGAILAVTVLLLLLAGCGAQSTGNAEGAATPSNALNSAEKPSAQSLTLPVIEENYWDLFDNNCYVIYEPGFTSLSGIELTLVSAVPLTQEDVLVTLDTGWDMIWYLYPYDFDTGLCSMYEDIFLLYQGVSTDELLAYAAGDLPSARKAEIDDLRYAFRALDDGEKPVIYRYTLDLCIPITEMDSEAVLDSLTITVHGETRTYQLGTIRNRMFEATQYVYDPNFSLNCDDNIGYFGHAVDVSSDGCIQLDGIRYNAVDDVVITGIRFYNGEDVELRSVSTVQTTADGMSIDTAWDMATPIELSAGESICLNVQIADPFFAETLGGWDARYLLLEYQSGGETYEIGIPFHFVQSLSDPFAYLAQKDGIDILSYYLDYINMLCG